jgi:solute carrier family 25 phosphate transporter 23/24/25/41
MSDHNSQGKVVANVGQQDTDELSIPEDRPFIPHLRSDSPTSRPHSLAAFREAEGREHRKRRLMELWKSLPEVLQNTQIRSSTQGEPSQLTPEKAKALRAMYNSELLLHCATPPGTRPQHIGWRKFKSYAEAKEIGQL